MSFVKPLALVLAASLTTGACATRQGRATALVGAGVLGALGTTFIAVNYDSPDNTAEEVFAPVYNGATIMIGGAALLAAAVVAIVALASDPKPDDMPRPIEEPPPVAPTRVALPDVATDDRTLQLARQARRAALQLQCAVVNVLVSDIEERDPDYFVALVTGGALAPCR
jgi:hypothetical protein